MNWYKLKIADRTGTPEAFDPDRRLRNPYLRPKPGDGNGNKMTTPGEMSGFGTRFRGSDFPNVPSSLDSELSDNNDKKEPDLPSVWHTLLGRPDKGDKTTDAPEYGDDPVVTEGLTNGELADPEDPLSLEKIMQNRMNERSSDGTSRKNGIPTSKNVANLYRQVSLRQNLPKFS